MGDHRPGIATVVGRTLAGLALVAPFFFPWQLASAVGVVAAIFVPPAALAEGIIADALYLTHGGYALPIGTFAGLAVMIGAYIVRAFVKARIMTA